ncbi:C-type lectin domain family 4 member G-like [Spea bombifrons]|uniref:C-type lectin domain family 4 member G-like n=1 Tax=Spea bombifrons TaxID=233779 RepID=UPI00234BD825|nr:C-type lectin domain family 4 member G-like [Spea bombifrons]
MFLLWVIQISVMMSYFSQVLQHTKKGQESVIAEIHEFYSKVVLHLTESQKNLTVEIQQLKTEMFKPSCPSTWKQIQSKCYYISTTSLTWEEAKEDCIARQGQLLVLRDQTESNALRVYLSPQPFWISLKRKINTWIWLDGTIPSFTSWAPYEPNNARGIEDCVELKEGLWNDVACTKKNPYVCKSIWFY